MDLKTLRGYKFHVVYHSGLDKTELFIDDMPCALFRGEHTVEYCCFGSGNVEGYMESREFQEAVALIEDDPRFAYYNIKSAICWIRTNGWSERGEYFTGE